eukprot:SAG31_NODE_856_length_11439_cov_3.721233_2_plen_506_part_00
MSSHAASLRHRTLPTDWCTTKRALLPLIHSARETGATASRTRTIGDENFLRSLHPLSSHSPRPPPARKQWARPPEHPDPRFYRKVSQPRPSPRSKELSDGRQGYLSRAVAPPSKLLRGFSVRNSRLARQRFGTSEHFTNPYHSRLHCYPTPRLFRCMHAEADDAAVDVERKQFKEEMLVFEEMLPSATKQMAADMDVNLGMDLKENTTADPVAYGIAEPVPEPFLALQVSTIPAETTLQLAKEEADSGTAETFNTMETDARCTTTDQGGFGTAEGVKSRQIQPHKSAKLTRHMSMDPSVSKLKPIKAKVLRHKSSDHVEERKSERKLVPISANISSNSSTEPRTLGRNKVISRHKSYDRALDQLQGRMKQLGTFAEQHGQRVKQAHSTTVWVGGIPIDLAREKNNLALKQALEYFGAVLSVQVRVKMSVDELDGGPCKSWALVTFLDVTRMQEAIRVGISLPNAAKNGEHVFLKMAQAKVGRELERTETGKLGQIWDAQRKKVVI